MTKQIILLAVAFLTLLGCGKDPVAGGTGVGNPTEVAMVPANGGTLNNQGFENDSTTRAIQVNDTVNSLTYTINNVSMELAKIEGIMPSVGAQPTDSDIPVTITADGYQIEGPITIKPLDSDNNSISCKTPTGELKIIRFIMESDGRTEATVDVSGTVAGIDTDELPFSFSLPINTMIQFKKHGQPLVLGDDLNITLEVHLLIESWFNNFNPLDLVSKDDAINAGVLEIKPALFTNDSVLHVLRNNIRQSGELHFEF